MTNVLAHFQAGFVLEVRRQGHFVRFQVCLGLVAAVVFDGLNQCREQASKICCANV